MDTRDTASVKAFVQRSFAAAHPGASLVLIPRVFHDMEVLFLGGHPDFAAADLRYHDWEHTVQATLCLALLLEGRANAAAEPRISARHFELALAAALLHDSGYIKLRSDRSGTGAKYTFCHVLRSCTFAASYLPTLGVNDREIEAVLAAINCTGPSSEISRLQFREPVQRIIGAALATADYLGQMAATDYPDELTELFREFAESDDFLGVPRERRLFRSAADLTARTPQFWYRFVRPKLETDFLALYRFLALPYPEGENAYLDAVETNMAQIQRRTADQRAHRAPPHSS